jgi:RNA polymerase sigma factor (sigma-70 family)
MQAEEVMHDTLLKFFETDIVFPSEKDRDKWMTRVCINLALDQLRKNKTEENIFVLDNLSFFEEADVPQTTEQEDDFKFRGITPKQVRKGIDSLAEGYRIIMTLFLFDGYDYEEIAQITGLKESSVRSHYTRGKMKLISQLKKENG